MPPTDGNFWDTILLYLAMVGTWLIGEGGKAALAGAAGGLIRWTMAEKRRIREGFFSVATGAVMAHFGTPVMVLLLEKWFGSFVGNIENTAAFCAGIVGMSLAKLVIAYIEAHNRKIEDKHND